MQTHIAMQGIIKMKPSLCDKGHLSAQEQLFLEVFEKDTYFAPTCEVH